MQTFTEVYLNYHETAVIVLSSELLIINYCACLCVAACRLSTNIFGSVITDLC